MSVVAQGAADSYTGDSWEDVQRNGSGKVVFIHSQAEPFVSVSDGQKQGIEYEIINSFYNYLNGHYGYSLDSQWVSLIEFQDMYRIVRDSKGGVFAASNISITEGRKSEIQFSPAYLPDVEVVISSLNLPVVTDTADFVEKFAEAEAVTLANTTFERNLKSVRANLLPDLEIKIVNDYDELMEEVSSNEDVFGYVSLPIYVKGLNKGMQIQRQRVLLVNRTGVGMAFPRESDWAEPLEAYFSSEEFVDLRRRLIVKYFGEKVSGIMLEEEQLGGTYNDERVRQLMEESELAELQSQRNRLRLQQLEEKARQRNWLFYSIIGVLVLAVGLVAVRNLEKRLSNSKLQQKNLEIERRNRDISDSIQYGKRIQQALMPDASLFNQHFKDSFVLYRPKDIVSGDFFWLHNQGDKTIVAVIDCVGHGVPGAFMTLLANALLNNIVIESGMLSPLEILGALDRRYTEMFVNDQGQIAVRGGMDVGVCLVDHSAKTIIFAGAKSSLLFVRNGNVSVVKGSRRPIGDPEHYHKTEFQAHHVDYYDGDAVYMYSDGYTDQFGGEENTKFSRSKMRQIIGDVHSLGMEQQKEILKAAFENWRGEGKQTDDMTFVGIRL